MAIISLLVVLVMSLLIVRIATVALTLTGMSVQLARFQARSAFTGTGFTTSEAEAVLQHPVRRRIIMLLMLLGNAGIVTAVATLIAAFAKEDQTGILPFPVRLAILALGLTILWLVATSQWVDQRMSRIISWALKRWTTLEVRDYAGLLHLTGDYIVAELTVEPGDWLCDRELKQLRLNDEGVLVLGIERSDGSYVGAPRGDSRLSVQDRLLLYGRQDVLENLDERRGGTEGNWEHYKAIERQVQIEKQQRASEKTEEAGERS